MSTDSDTTDDSEHRPTDCLATTGRHYGLGRTTEDALFHCLRYGGPWEDRDEPISVAVWELYADSWQSHGPTGPERSAEQVSYTEYEIPADLASEASTAASDGWFAVDEAIHEGGIVHEEGEPDED